MFGCLWRAPQDSGAVLLDSLSHLTFLLLLLLSISHSPSLLPPARCVAGICCPFRGLLLSICRSVSRLCVVLVKTTSLAGRLSARHPSVCAVARVWSLCRVWSSRDGVPSPLGVLIGRGRGPCPVWSGVLTRGTRADVRSWIRPPGDGSPPPTYPPAHINRSQIIPAHLSTYAPPRINSSFRRCAERDWSQTHLRSASRNDSVKAKR